MKKKSEKVSYEDFHFEGTQGLMKMVKAQKYEWRRIIGKYL